MAIRQAQFAVAWVIHGELFNLSQTQLLLYLSSPFHIIITQPGRFSSPSCDPRECRSPRVCSDGRQMIEAPILHVNITEDPSAGGFSLDAFGALNI